MNWLNTSRNKGRSNGDKENRKRSTKNRKSIDIEIIRAHVLKRGQGRKIGRSIKEERRRSAKNTDDTTVVILIDSQ